MIMKIRLFILSILCALVTPITLSAQQPSQAANTVLEAGTRIIDTLQVRREEFQSDRAALRQFVDEELNRLFDREYAARLVLGIHGRGADAADISLFADAMTDSLLARYGSLLLEIQGNPQFHYRSEAALPGNRGVKVSTELVRSAAESTPVDYLLRQVDGQWKIFDVSIEGVSYIQTFRSQFDTSLRQKSIRQVAEELRNSTSSNE